MLLQCLLLALVILQVCVLCGTSLLTAACSISLKPRSTSNSSVAWSPLE